MPDLDREALIAVLDVLPVGVIVMQPERDETGCIVDFTYVYANPVPLAHESFSGVRIGDRLRERIPVEVSDVEALVDQYVGAYEHNRPIDDRVEVRARDGSVEHHDLRARRVGDLLLLQVEEVTAEVAAREAEAAAHRRVTEMLERINDAMYSVDSEWRITFANTAAARSVGYQPDEVVGMKLFEEFPGLAGNEFERHFRHAVAYQTTAEFEAYFPAPLEAWFTVRAYPSEDGLTVYFQNVDARHRVEARAVDLERLESTAMRARAATQDFNNILMVIGGHAELLEDTLSGDDPLLDDVRPIREGARRATELVQQLLSFGRSQELSVGVVDLNTAVLGDEATLRHVLPPSVHLELVSVDEPVLVDIDPDQLQRTILQLVANGAEAMPRGGALTVSVSAGHVDEAESLAHPERAPGWYGVLTVADEGKGMTEEVRRRAFELFFTTRDGEGATGLGLSAVQGMARRAGGFVVLSSEPGQGTAVSVHLPRSAADPAPD